MGRRRKVERRSLSPDPNYDSAIVAHFINNIMRRGKKSVAERIVYRALDRIREQREGEDPLEVFSRGPGFCTGGVMWGEGFANLHFRATVQTFTFTLSHIHTCANLQTSIIPIYQPCTHAHTCNCILMHITFVVHTPMHTYADVQSLKPPLS